VILRAYKLHKLGILGINGRNLDYVLKYNKRKYYPLVDDKFKTKTLALEADIPTPELYCVIRSQGEMYKLNEIEADSFVIKPARGSGGEGILIIRGKGASGYRKGNGVIISEAEVRYHISNILSGLYSLGGRPDKALIEYAVNFDPIFNPITYQGVPDIRIIACCGVPAMAMIRLPTRESDGKANLHKGGIGVGLNMQTGETLFGVQRNTVITHHPDTGHPIEGYTIPQWEKLLEIASRFYGITRLGYIGVDLVLDQKLGPLVLEVNARPGLSIQIANREGLLPRLRKIEANLKNLTNSAEKVNFSRQHFAPRPISN
jgi:alpha-L-glutamate ligase-like protein